MVGEARNSNQEIFICLEKAQNMEHNLTKKKMNNKRELNAIPVTIEDGKQNRDFDLRSY